MYSVQLIITIIIFEGTTDIHSIISIFLINQDGLSETGKNRVTVVSNWNFTAVKFRHLLLFQLPLRLRVWKQTIYTIENCCEIATRNEKKNYNFSKFVVFFEKAVILENVQIWNQSIFLNETFRRASSLRLIENECIVDGYGLHLMPAMSIFSKTYLFKKGHSNQQILNISKIFFSFLVAIL